MRPAKSGVGGACVVLPERGDPLDQSLEQRSEERPLDEPALVDDAGGGEELDRQPVRLADGSCPAQHRLVRYSEVGHVDQVVARLHHDLRALVQGVDSYDSIYLEAPPPPSAVRSQGFRPRPYCSRLRTAR